MTKLTKLSVAGFGFLIVLYVTLLSLFGQSLFTDELYNHALTLRSALPSAAYPLETSYAHWYFDHYEIVRAEDWHRSIHLIALSWLHEILPGSSEAIIEALNLVMIFVYLAFVVMIAVIAIKPDIHDPLVRASCLAGVLVLVTAPWFAPTVFTDYLDDLPTTIVALCAFFLVIRYGVQSAGLGFSVGLIVALSVAIKDFSLIYVPALLLACATIGLLERRLLGAMTFCALLVVGFVTGFAPKLMWNYAELGSFLPDQARTALNARLLDVYKGEPQIFISRADIEPPYSWLELVREEGARHVIGSGVGSLYWAITRNWPIVLGTTLAMLVLLLGGPRARSSPAATRLIVVALSLAFGLFLFFSLSLGEARQFRYWMTLCCLCAAMIGAALAHLSSRTSVFGKGVARLVVAGTVVFLLLTGFGNVTKGLRSALNPGQDMYAGVGDALRMLAERGTVMLHTNEGVSFWRDMPEAEILSVQPGVLVRMSAEEFRSFLQVYPVVGAAFRRGDIGIPGLPSHRTPVAPDAVEYLLAQGFCILHEDVWTLLAAPAECASPTSGPVTTWPDLETRDKF